MEQKVWDYITKYQLLENAQTVVVALSGGADSVCLLWVLSNLCKTHELPITLRAIHVNHGIRKGAAEEDEKFVTEFCESLRVPLKVFHTDVPKLAKVWKMTEEEAGRKYRYDCFKEYCQDLPGAVVAVAHHQDDQAETMLFRMARGTGIDGLAAMKEKVKKDDILYIRPLLGVSRQDIEAYVKEKQLTYCTDQTNADIKYHRNYIRHEILPRMKEVNPQSVEHLCGLARQAAEYAEFVNAMAKEWLDSHLLAECCTIVDEPELGAKNMYGVPLEAFAKQPKVMKMAILREFVNRTSDSLKDITAKHMELILDICEAQSGKAQLPYGIYAFISYGKLFLGKNITSRDEIAREEELKKMQEMFDFSVINMEHMVKLPKNNYTKIIDYAKINVAPVVRFRQPKDFICLDIAGHQKSIARFMIDEKIPQYKREHIPLVCQGNEVIWVVGYRLSPKYYVDGDTTQGYKMTFKQPE